MNWILFWLPCFLTDDFLLYFWCWFYTNRKFQGKSIAYQYRIVLSEITLMAKQLSREVMFLNWYLLSTSFFLKAQKWAMHTQIMLNRIRLPAKLPCHVYNLWLVSCSFLLSRQVLSIFETWPWWGAATKREQVIAACKISNPKLNIDFFLISTNPVKIF